MLKLTEPVIDPEIRKEVPDRHVGPAIGIAKIEENRSDDSKAEIAEEDQVLVFVLVQWAGRVEVVDTVEPAIHLAHSLAFNLFLVLVVAGHVGDKV